MALVFISYTHKSKELADNLQKRLEDNGHEVWRDVTSAKYGLLPERVASGVAACDYMVVLVTEGTEESRWMTWEVNLFLQDISRIEKLIPARFGKTQATEVSAALGGLKWIDCRDSNRESGINEILAILQNSKTKTSSQELQKDLSRLYFAIDLAVAAGTTAMRFYHGAVHPNSSIVAQSESFVKNPSTAADKAAQAEITLRKVLKQDDYGDDAMIAEEYGHVSGRQEVNLEGYTWVVDALDGTVNFDNKVPLFCSGIGGLKDGEPHIGVVYDPVQHEVYYAMKKLGAAVWSIPRGEVKPIHCSDIHALEKSLVGVHISARDESRDRMFERLSRIASESRYLRSFGSGLLALAYVASGRIQAFYSLDTHIWDQVAGVVLVQQANGDVWDLNENTEWQHQTRDVLASCNKDIREEFNRHYNRR